LLDFFTPQENTQPLLTCQVLRSNNVSDRLASIGRLAETRRKPDVESLLRPPNDPSEALKAKIARRKKEKQRSSKSRLPVVLSLCCVQVTSVLYIMDGADAAGICFVSVDGRLHLDIFSACTVWL